MIKTYLAILSFLVVLLSPNLAFPSDDLTSELPTIEQSDSPGLLERLFGKRPSIDLKRVDSLTGEITGNRETSANDLPRVGKAMHVLEKLFISSQDYREPILVSLIQKIQDIDLNTSNLDSLARASHKERLFWALGKILFASGVTPDSDTQLWLAHFLKSQFENITPGISSRAQMGINIRILLVAAQMSLTWQKENSYNQYEETVELVPEKNEIVQSLLANFIEESLKRYEELTKNAPESADAILAKNMLDFTYGVGLFSLDKSELIRHFEQMKDGQEDWRLFEIFVEVNSFLTANRSQVELSPKNVKLLSKLNNVDAITEHPSSGGEYLLEFQSMGNKKYQRLARNLYFPDLWDANWIISTNQILVGEGLSPNLNKPNRLKIGLPALAFDQSEAQRLFLTSVFPRFQGPSFRFNTEEEFNNWLNKPIDKFEGLRRFFRR